MDITLIKDYIKPELTILIFVMYVIGIFIKNSTIFKDKFIPLILGIIGIFVAAFYLFATMPATSTQEILMIIYMAITQGILCAAAPVYFNQLYKQYTAPDEDIIKINK